MPGRIVRDRTTSGPLAAGLSRDGPEPLLALVKAITPLRAGNHSACRRCAGSRVQIARYSRMNMPPAVEPSGITGANTDAPSELALTDVQRAISTKS